MNVLIVDDQQAVIDSLRKEIHWRELSVDKVYTALSAREARMALRNFEVDILLTDIEMPEEDGLSLFRWTRENDPHVVGIFLTAHADFHYAQEAIHMGGFDYILQPFKGEEVEKALHKAAQSLRSRAIAERRASPYRYIKPRMSRTGNVYENTGRKKTVESAEKRKTRRG